ncbi:MAG: phytoene/squalene synthase family protein [Hoeflea sp.]|uniref:phytoene/squalene synthase family protein n=1 Tax=Hoeflea sp. TaxID=1940281 RepID=UPI001D736428|nr:phytoene/squalene synthase family protein [Hoeflea sp.]MBU4527832.1 phytoene/squalene synthase family protein [Alphaproteobacteria bacterium]MBU4546133.1 phytoene/squalene synthase family protein [Alphaproteobacteria bacterium]MBU4553182.1 phytoene/squalene synthase family protein [Alphaproteobacteria bacterium]MBV1724254.1 phytoene/squalene synthase family protein [Hoeflea sp.]MBV1759939.1 phytoene/squalene synthase family protein [Hoeflea sp.]
MPAPSPDAFVLDPGLRRECEEAIRAGSKSFLAASMLLPGPTRSAARALYAFCRAADDLIDESADPAEGLFETRARLDAIYRGTPRDHPADRAFVAVVEHYAIPRALPAALIEGFAWDVENRSYRSCDELCAYSARVASTVGVMMTLIMGVCDRAVLARAADLGLAMQLTNIARDVGEDARRGRIYLPLDWLEEAGIDPQAFLSDPQACPAMRATTERLLDSAHILYARAMTGIAGLPLSCRTAIRSAALIYREIGREIEIAGHDSITRRAHTSTRRKLELIARAAATPFLFQPVSTEPAHPEVRFLVEAAAAGRVNAPSGFDAKAGRMIELMALSETRRRAADANA